MEEVLREIEEKETEAAAEEDDIPEEPRVERRSAEARGEQADGATEQNEELEPRVRTRLHLSFIVLFRSTF